MCSPPASLFRALAAGPASGAAGTSALDSLVPAASPGLGLAILRSLLHVDVPIALFTGTPGLFQWSLGIMFCFGFW